MIYVISDIIITSWSLCNHPSINFVSVISVHHYFCRRRIVHTHTQATSTWPEVPDVTGRRPFERLSIGERPLNCRHNDRSLPRRTYARNGHLVPLRFCCYIITARIWSIKMEPRYRLGENCFITRLQNWMYAICCGITQYFYLDFRPIVLYCHWYIGFQTFRT